MALGGQCCYGLSISSNCVLTEEECMSRTVNRGWSVCCEVGAFYSPASQQCSRDCSGLVLFGSICLSANQALDFSVSRPVEVSLSTQCNGKPLSPLLPVCCPFGFYIADSEGCQRCSGNIFTLPGRQLCCSHSEYYDSSSQ